MKKPDTNSDTVADTGSSLDLEDRLGYRFADRLIIREALCHRSYFNEQAQVGDLKDNERLEFLGDAVLNLVISHLLMQRFPSMREGDMSRIRSQLVNERQLAKVANRIALGEFVLLGKGESQGQGQKKKSILANTFEAVLAAVYQDGGFDAAFQVVRRHFDKLLEAYTDSDVAIDHKSRLQEMTQLVHQAVPEYTVIAESGPDHDKTFEVEVAVQGVTSRGVGKSKKAAEQDAARNALSNQSP